MDTPYIRKTSETIPITVPLSPLDHEQIHAEMIEHNRERARLETKIDDHKGAIKAAQKGVDTLNSKIYDGIRALEDNEKTVAMECWRVTDYETGLVRWVSKDSGEVVKERALTDPERQQSMDFETAAGEEVTVIGAESSPDVHPDDAPAEIRPESSTDQPAEMSAEPPATDQAPAADEAPSQSAADPPTKTRAPLSFKFLKVKAEKRRSAHV